MSVLNSEYIRPTRPYSTNELNDKLQSLNNRLRLSNVFVFHKKCKHTYKVRKNSKKLIKIEETGENDVGNCSICWKLSKCNDEDYSKARDLVDMYEQILEGDVLTYDRVDIESCYYRWLYED